jgi:hypothetical protein
MKYFLYCLQHYADFTGRARRSEYWYFVLFNFIVSILIGLSLGVIAGLLNVPALVYLVHLWSLAVFIPSLAVSVRRLHDIGRSGWWLLLSLIPLVGAIILIIWHCTDSQPGANQYGPNPKEMDY